MLPVLVVRGSGVFAGDTQLPHYNKSGKQC